MGSTTLGRSGGLLRVLVGAPMAAMLVALGCTAEKPTQVRAVAPGAISDASSSVTSGRFEATMTSVGATTVSTGRFQGDDMAVTTRAAPPEEGSDDLPASDPPMPRASESESRIVDGHFYMDVRGLGSWGLAGGPGTVDAGDGPAWVEFPTDDLTAAHDTAPDDTAPDDAAQEGPDEFYDDPFATMIDALGTVVVDRPGEPVDLDGVAATRYEVALTGAEATGLMSDTGILYPPDDMSGYMTEGLGSDGAQRMRAIQDYAEAHTSLEVSADIDDSGKLLSAELTATYDVGDYPECSMFVMDAGTAHFVLSDLGEPQVIEAPPADQVRSWDEAMGEVIGDLGVIDSDGPASEDSGTGFGSDPGDDVTADGAPAPDWGTEEGVDLPEDFQQDPVLDTVAGPRSRYRVLDELIEWAGERNIDWKTVPPLESDQLVALYNMFFDQELETRGPALPTSDGLYSRGDVVDAVSASADMLGIDPASVPSMDDAALIAQVERLITDGHFPEGGFFTDDGAHLGDALPSDPPADDPATGDDWFSSDAVVDEIFDGCPS